MASSETSSLCPAVGLHGVQKAFAATVAVDGVSFEIAEGKVHALLGENGAGKSTIVKLLSGLITPDSGHFSIFGEEVRLTNPRLAHGYSIQTAFQEMTLVKDLSVFDNMLLPYAPTNLFGVIRRRKAEDAVRAHFAAIKLEGIDPRSEIRDLDLAIQQKIEIARAIFRAPRILLLDEPTSTLSGRDVDWLGDVIAQQKAKGTTVVFISHRLREVRTFCDSLTVLRNGQHIATTKVGDVADDEVIKMIIGRSLDRAFPPRPDPKRTLGPEVLSAEGIGAAGRLKELSFSLRKGEILGVAGLQGMGQLELFLSCFGMVERISGRLSVDGEPIVLSSPADAVRADIGISLVPEDRKTEALFLNLRGGHNVSLPTIDRFTRFGLIDRAKERRAVANVLRRVDVEPRALWTRVGDFSGGNQQKIAIGKWLLAESRVLLLYDPTRGIDVGTKHELYQLMRDYADSGGAILFYSTEIPELVNLADRVVVLYGGRAAAELEGQALSEPAILRAALGSGSLAEGAA